MENSIYERLLLTVASALTVAVIKFIFDFFNKGHERIRVKSESVKLIDHIINTRSWKGPENRVIIEEAFQHLYKKPLNFYEINILLYANTPNDAFKTYLKYRQHIKLNDTKNKFVYKTEKRPYWSIKKIRLPKIIIKGIMLYSLLSLPSMYGALYMLDKGGNFNTSEVIYFWFLILSILAFSIGFLFSGIKYQDSERDIIRTMSDIFNIENT